MDKKEKTNSYNKNGYYKVNAQEYDLDVTGVADSGPGFKRIFRDIQHKNEPVYLELEPGTYRITKETAHKRVIHASNTDSGAFPEKTIGLLIESQSALTLDGNGAHFMFEGDMMALGILKSKHIIIKNLSWDFKDPSTSELTVFNYSLEEKTVDYYIPSTLHYEIDGTSIHWLSEQDTQGTYYWKEKDAHRNSGIQIQYPTTRMGRSYNSDDSPFRDVTRIEALESGLVRFTYKTHFKIEPVLGMNYQLLSNTERSTPGALVYESQNIHFENVHIAYMHGFGLLVQMCENVTFNQVKIQTNPETGRKTASFADGIHVSGAKGMIQITNCSFNNTHDDPINIHGTFTRVEKIEGTHTLTLNYIHSQQVGFTQFHPGDKVVFYPRDTLQSSDNETEYTVKKVKGPFHDNLQSMVVEFEEPIPSYLTECLGSEPRYVAENITYTPQIIIKNCTFKNVFTRAILATSRKQTVIEGNYFEGTTMATLFFSNDSNEWYESGPIRNLLIRNNTFIVKSIGRTWWKYAPAIYIHPVTKDNNSNHRGPIHHNITIEANTFYLEHDGVLRAEYVKGLIFKNNRILRNNPQLTLHLSAPVQLNENGKYKPSLHITGAPIKTITPLPLGPENNSGSVSNILEFEACEGVVVKNNMYDDGLKRFVLIEMMDSNNVQISDPLCMLTKRKDTSSDNPLTRVCYISTQPQIATIDHTGLITPHAVGTTKVYAYGICQGTLIKSNEHFLTTHYHNHNIVLCKPQKETLNNVMLSNSMTLKIPMELEYLDYHDFDGHHHAVKVTGRESIKVKNATVYLQRFSEEKVNLKGVIIGKRVLNLKIKDSFIDVDPTIFFQKIRIEWLREDGVIYVRHLGDDCIYTPDHQGDIDLPVYPGVTSYMLQTSMNAKNPCSIHVIHFLKVA